MVNFLIFLFSLLSLFSLFIQFQIKGIGASTARMFSQEGATVVIVDRDSENAHKVLSEIIAAGGKGVVITADVSKEVDMEEVFKKVDETYHKLDILVANAGFFSFF